MAANSKANSTNRSIFRFKGSSKTAKSSPSKIRYHPVTQRRPWTPGIRRTPLMALGAIILTTAAIATCIGILVGSDGKPINNWTFQPTVYLAIATTTSNICLHFAFAEGVTNMWWIKALRGTTVGDLHRTHEFGNNFWAALLAFRYINFIALGCLIVTISPLNGPLMQRASQIATSGTHATIRDLAVPISATIPASFTAYLSSRELWVGMLQRTFIPVVYGCNAQTPIHVKNGCSGTCNGRLRGAGFSVNCTQSTLSFSLVPSGPDDTISQQHPYSQYFGISLNSSMYGMPLNSGTFSVVFKNTTACEGELQIQNCTLKPATVSYPVSIDGGRQSVSLQQGTTIWDDEVYSVLPDMQVEEARNTFGGLYQSLGVRYEANIVAEWDVIYGLNLISGGFVADSYAIIPPGTGQGYINCSYSYSNPMPDMLQSARDLMFRTAMAAAAYDANSTNAADLNVEVNGPSDANLKKAMQTITVTQTSSEPRYRSEYAWLAGALIVTLIPTFCVTGMFWGFWKLGRPVDMSPIETAKALGSPLLISNDGNATGREIARELNGKQVKYGGVASDAIVETPTSHRGSDSQIPSQARASGNETVDEDKEDATRLRLLMKSPEMVLAPLRGWIFAG